ncbi:MAG TPA: hexose kinase [Verrucomicrobiae bacterium]
MILCLGTTPATQRVMVFKRLAVDAVNRAATTLDGIAGKSINVAKVLQTLGADPLATGFLGGPRGDTIRQELARKCIQADFIGVSAATRQCITLIDESAATTTELVEESPAVEPGDFQKLAKLVERRLKDCQAIVMSGTITPGGPADFYRQCLELARSFGVLGLVDAQGPALAEALKAHPGLVKPNRQELARTLACELRTETEVIAAMRETQRRGAQRVVVTSGKQPTLALEGSRLWRIPSPRVRAINPIGSGDAFTAALVWRLVQADNLGEACRWGAAAGAANALTLMPGELELPDLERLAAEIVVENLA